MEDNRLYSTIWVCISTIIIVVALAIMSSSIHDSNKVAEMVNQGANPLEARCAINDYSDVCKIIASNK